MRMVIRFGKSSRLRFISHLDLQRFLHMALNRTGLPILYSQGFNPHPVMAFGSALALGYTSEYEILDVRLSAPMGRRRCEEAIRKALPPEMPIYELKLVDDKAPAVMSRVFASDYRIEINGSDAEKMITSVRGFLDLPVIPMMKKSKSGEKEVDIKPRILSIVPEGRILNVRLKLTEDETLKPDLLMNALAAFSGAADYTYRVHRLTLLGSSEDGGLRKMMEL